jgi:hypothetical protein
MNPAATKGEIVKQDGRTFERVSLGGCAVDSGQLIIVDPCYVKDGLDYEGVCNVSDSADEGGEVLCLMSAFVASSTSETTT